MSSLSPSISMTNDSSGINDAFEQYRKTCSIIFGRASSSQLRYLQASIEIQQSLLTSCDSTIAKQITWFEDYAKKRNNKSKNYLILALEPFLHSFTTAVEAYIAMVSISYDIATNKAYTHMTLWLTRSHTYKKITKNSNRSHKNQPEGFNRL